MRKLFVWFISISSVVNFAYADVYSDGMNQAKEVIKNSSGSLYNTNSPETNGLQGSINNWLDKSDGNLNAIMGDDSKELVTVGTGSKVDVKMDCVVSQQKIAELDISDGAPVNINLSVFSNNGLGIAYSSTNVQNITGVCPNKFTVCDESENRRLCNLTYNYTNYGNENKEIPGLGSSATDNMTKEQIKSHACYRVTKCMSWQFKTKALNDDIKLLVLGNASGQCSNVFNKSGITVGEKDMFIEQVKSVVAEITAEGLSSVSSDETNSKTEFYALSTGSCSNGNYGTGMTDVDDLLDYYNKPSGSTDSSDIVNNYGGNGSMFDEISNSQSVKDNPFDEDVVSSVNKGFDNIGNLTSGVNVPKVCYTPNCTIDVTEKITQTNTDGTVVEQVKQSRIFRDCTASGYTETNGVKKTQYSCPANGVTEKIVAQDNGDICTCDNKHELAVNLQKTLIASSMADAIYNSACGKRDEEDNKTVDAINDRREECTKYSGEAYNECMNKSF